MPRSRRAKSQSVSSASGAAEPSTSTSAGTMAPPSPPVTATSTPKTTRHRKTPSASIAASPRDRDTPLTAAKRIMDQNDVPVGTPSIPPQNPGVPKFLLVAGVSSLLEVFLQSLVSQIGTSELAAVSKHSESWVDIGGLLAWRLTTLGVYWFGGFDAYDVASITVLLQTPTLLLLRFFYLVSSNTLAFTSLSTILSTTVPFLLLRSISPTHAPRSHPHAPRALLRNRSILTDPLTTLITTLLSSAIFTVVLQLSFQTFLPVLLVTTFDNLKSLEFIHLGPSGLLILLLGLLPAGYACTQFLFAPSTGATELTASAYNFDGATATLGAHFYHNAWGWYSARQKTLIGRSVVLGVLVVTETVVQCAVGLAGVEVRGALGYAGVWAAGIAVTAALFDWVGGPSD